jgi:hypothetical protein
MSYRGPGTVTYGRPAALDDGGSVRSGPEPPTGGAILTILGAVFVLIGGASEAFSNAAMPDIVFGSTGTTARVLGLWGIAAALGLVTFGALSFLRPNRHVSLGMLILGLSAGSLLCEWGGVGLGAVLGFLGGALILRWTSAPSPPKRGRLTQADVNVAEHPPPATPDVASLPYRG